MQAIYVLCEVETKFSSIMYIHFNLQRIKYFESTASLTRGKCFHFNLRNVAKITLNIFFAMEYINKRLTVQLLD